MRGKRPEAEVREREREQEQQARARDATFYPVDEAAVTLAAPVEMFRNRLRVTAPSPWIARIDGPPPVDKSQRAGQPKSLI